MKDTISHASDLIKKLIAINMLQIYKREDKTVKA